jgi:hypothetical protein
MAMKYFAAIGLWMTLLSMNSFSQAPVSCGSLAKLALPNTIITIAQSIGAGEFEMPESGVTPSPQSRIVDTKSLPAFCRVAATLKPTSDSNIRIESGCVGLEWKIPGHGRRRLVGTNQSREAYRWAEARPCNCQYG